VRVQKCSRLLGEVAGDCTRGVKIRPLARRAGFCQGAPLGAPSPSATPATRQLLEEWRGLTHPHLARRIGGSWLRAAPAGSGSAGASLVSASVACWTTKYQSGCLARRAGSWRSAHRLGRRPRVQHRQPCTARALSGTRDYLWRSTWISRVLEGRPARDRAGQTKIPVQDGRGTRAEAAGR